MKNIPTNGVNCFLAGTVIFCVSVIMQMDRDRFDICILFIKKMVESSTYKSICVILSHLKYSRMRIRLKSSRKYHIVCHLSVSNLK